MRSIRFQTISGVKSFDIHATLEGIEAVVTFNNFEIDLDFLDEEVTFVR